MELRTCTDNCHSRCPECSKNRREGDKQDRGHNECADSRFRCGIRPFGGLELVTHINTRIGKNDRIVNIARSVFRIGSHRRRIQDHGTYLKMSVHEERTVEADPHHLNRLVVHIFLGVFIDRNHDSLPEPILFSNDELVPLCQNARNGSGSETRTDSLALCWTSPAVCSNIPDIVRNLLEIGLTARSSLVVAMAKFNLEHKAQGQQSVNWHMSLANGNVILHFTYWSYTLVGVSGLPLAPMEAGWLDRPTTVHPQVVLLHAMVSTL